MTRAYLYGGELKYVVCYIGDNIMSNKCLGVHRAIFFFFFWGIISPNRERNAELPPLPSYLASYGCSFVKRLEMQALSDKNLVGNLD